MRIHSTIWPRLLFLLAALTVGVAPVSADLILFTGLDPGAGPGQPHPNADAAAAAFANAVGDILPVVDFESFPIGPALPLTIAQGVTLNCSSFCQTSGGPGSVTLGYNTTAGGSRFVDSQSAKQLVITSQQQLRSFGAYVTGAQPDSLQLNITTIAGALAPITIPISPDGGALFVGFTGESVTTVVLSPPPLAGRAGIGSSDRIGLDDVRLGFVPEPSTSQVIMISLAVLALFDFGWRRRKRAR